MGAGTHVCVRVLGVKNGGRALCLCMVCLCVLLLWFHLGSPDEHVGLGLSGAQRTRAPLQEAAEERSLLIVVKLEAQDLGLVLLRGDERGDEGDV